MNFDIQILEFLTLLLGQKRAKNTVYLLSLQLYFYYSPIAVHKGDHISCVNIVNRNHGRGRINNIYNFFFGFLKKKVFFEKSKSDRITIVGSGIVRFSFFGNN